MIHPKIQDQKMKQKKHQKFNFQMGGGGGLWELMPHRL